MSLRMTNYHHDTELLLQKPRIVQLPKLHLFSTRNTIVTCTTCRGTRLISIGHADGTSTLKKCFACNGSGQTYISDEGLSHR